VNKLEAAARDFCAQSERMRESKTSWRSCTMYEEGDFSVGDTGTLPCDISDPHYEVCEACKERKAQEPVYREARKRRSLAARRMMTWYQNILRQEMAKEQKR
jgi:hypothetical protein